MQVAEIDRAVLPMNVRPRAIMPGHLVSLTSLRFFAAMLVVVHHAMDFSWQPLHLTIIERGGLAVDFFFVLSGFILMHVYGQTFTEGFGATKQFLLMRLARLYPLHLFILLLFVILVSLAKLANLPINPERYDVVSLLGHLALVDAWGFGTRLTWNYPAWSISAEWAAYLCFPVLVVGMARCKVWLTLLAVAGAWILCGEAFHLPERTVDFSVARILPEFAMGMLVYRLRPPQRRLPFAEAQFVALTVGLCLAVSWGLPDVWIALGFVYLIALAPGVGGWAGRALAHPALVRLGEESYALYMGHILVFSIFYNLIKSKQIEWVVSNPTAKDVVAIILAVFAAKILHRFVEIPGQKLIRGLARRPSLDGEAASGLGLRFPGDVPAREVPTAAANPPSQASATARLSAK